MKSPIQRLVIEFRGTFMSFLPQISLVNRRINLFGVLCLDSQRAIYEYGVVVHPVLIYPLLHPISFIYAIMRVICEQRDLDNYKTA